MTSADNEDSPVPDEVIVPLIEEDARIEKRQVQTGRVRIHRIADITEKTAAATLEEESVEITRVPVNQPVTTPPAIRTENGVTIVPILEEILFVEKRLMLKEELHIHRRVTQQTVEVPMTLKKQRAVVERVKTDPNSSKEE